MNIKSRILLFLIAVSSLVFTFPVQGQADCTVDSVLGQSDVLAVERLLPGCSTNVVDNLTEAAQTAMSNAQSPTETARLRTITALAFKQQGSDFDAKIAMQQALLDWRTAGDSVMEDRVLYYLGTFFYDAHQYDQGNAFYSQGFNLAKKNKDTFTEGRIKLAYGRYELSLGHNENALGLLTDGMPFLLQNPAIAVPEQIEALQLLSRVDNIFEKFDMGDFAASQAAFLRNNPNWYSDVVGAAETTACPFTTVSDQTDMIAVERGLPSCANDLPNFLKDTQSALDLATEPADTARLQTIVGLIYSTSGDDYHASLTFEKSLVSYRANGDQTNQGWALYYLARAYYSRKQMNNVSVYLGQAQQIATSTNDEFQLGRIRLVQAQYEIHANNDYNKAALLEEEGLEHLQAAGDVALADQIQMLDLLNQTYSVLGDLTKSGQYLRLSQSLKTGGAIVTNQQGSSLVAVSSCEVTNLVNQFDIVYVERQMSLCGNNLPGLVFTAQTMVATSDDPRIQGIAQIYVGMGQYFHRDVLTAYAELDAAETLLRQVGDPRLLGFAYYYLALNEFAKGQFDDGATYFELARRSWEKAGDNFDLGRVYLQLGLRASFKENFDLAVTDLEHALANIQSSPIYSHDEQATALNELITIYTKHIQNDERVQEYQQQLQSLYNNDLGLGEPTPAPDVANAEATPANAQASAECDPRGIVLQTDLVLAEKALVKCPDQLEDLLFQVQSAKEQATAETDIANYQNFLGIVDYYLGKYPDAIIEHNRALTRYRKLGDTVNEGRSLFYAGRSYLANNQTANATSFLSQARRIAINASDARGVAMVALLYGDQAYTQRNMDDALKQYGVAAQQLAQLDDPDETITTLLRLGQIHAERSEYDQAVDFYTQAADQSQTVGDTASFTRAKIGLADYDKYYGKYDDAVANVEAALAAATDDTSKALAIAERADIARYQEDYDTAKSILTLDPTSYDCVTGDQIRLYTGYYYIAVGQAADALQQFRPLLEAATCDQRSALAVAKASAGIADAQLSRRSGDSLVSDAINSAIRDYDKLDYPRGYESARIQMARFSFYGRNYDDAEKWLSTAENKALEINDLPVQAEVQMVRVDISIDRGRYADALDDLQAASGIYNQLDFAPGVSATVERRLRIFLDQARYDDAIKLIQFAQENYKSLSLSFDSRIAFYQGRYYEQIGQSDLALTYYDQALTGFQSAGEILSIADVQLQKAHIYQQRGQYEQVEPLIGDLKNTMTEQENSYYLALIDATLGDNDVLVWDAEPNHTSTSPSLQDAGTAYQEALVNFVASNNVAGQARVNNSLGELELDKTTASLSESDRYQPTSTSIQNALQLYRVIGNSLGVADSLYNLGRFYLLSFDADNAVTYFSQALTEVGDNDPLRRANMLTALGEAYEYKHVARKLPFGVASNDLYLAVQSYQEATQLLAFTYAEIADKDTQRQFGTQDQTLAPYTRLLRIYAVYTLKDQEADAENALFYSEQSRARSYLTQLQGEQLTLGDSQENSSLTQWQTLRDQVVSLNQLLHQINAQSGDAAETENIQQQIKDDLDQMQGLEGQTQLSSLQQFVSIQVSDLPTIEKALPDNTVMASYYVLPAEHTYHGDEAARILILLISKDGIQKVSQRVGDYQTDLLNQVDAILRSHSPVSADKLYKVLVAPIADQIALYANLVIVPHNVLNYVPFEALTDKKGQPLVNTFNTSYIPSATVYTLLRNTVKQSDHTGEILGLGYSGIGENLPPLTYYSDELKGIQSTVPNVKLFMDDDATEAQLTDLANVDVIHIAAHGKFDGQNPLSSFIALAPSGDSDGLLQVREVYQLNLKASNPLITLSACELAISQVNPGDELEGMTRAFLLTGARGVIASMWPVDDFITSELMQDFYQNRATGMTNAQALTEAKRTIDENYGDMYLWAGFVLVGLEN